MLTIRLLNQLAYVDPVSGSILIQLIIAGAVGVVGFFRRSIFGGLGRLVGRRQDVPEDGNPALTGKR
jgi:hypothetical protein